MIAFGTHCLIAASSSDTSRRHAVCGDRHPEMDTCVVIIEPILTIARAVIRGSEQLSLGA
jgi:hypothetical protein